MINMVAVNIKITMLVFLIWLLNGNRVKKLIGIFIIC